jgi:cytochrome P450
MGLLEFGAGPHVSAGTHIAPLVAAIAVETLLKRRRNLEPRAGPRVSRQGASLTQEAVNGDMAHLKRDDARLRDCITRRGTRAFR